MKIRFGLSLSVLVFFLAGCSSKTLLPSTYGKDAISIVYSSDKDINSYEGSAHSLVLVVYQMEKPDAFMKMSKNKKGVQELLAGSDKDQSFISYNTYIVMPEEEKEIRIDRLDKTLWVGIIAGFYKYNQIEGLSFLQQVPVDESLWHSVISKEIKCLDLSLSIKIKKSSIQKLSTKIKNSLSVRR